MISYQELDWPTLHFVQQYLLQIEQDLPEALLNTVQAWSALIEFKNQEKLPQQTFTEITAHTIPTWVKEYLGQQTHLRIEFTYPFNAHLAVFLESLLQLYQLVETLRSVSTIQIMNAPHSKRQVYLRVILAMDSSKTPFISLDHVAEKLNEENSSYRLAIVQDMFALNKAKFSLQYNKQTGQQAFSACFDAQETDSLEEVNSESPTTTFLTPLLPQIMGRLTAAHKKNSLLDNGKSSHN